MCLGIPAQLVAGEAGHPDLDMVNNRVEHSGPLAVLG